MNHLAHLFLVTPEMEVRVGSLLGDFARGLDIDRLPAGVVRGLRHHRAVDAFTDRHPEVLACKQLFSRRRRRFAGIALDVLFDHYLLRHWERYSHQGRDEFIADAYRDLQRGRHLMPESMARVIQRMIEQDWLGSYQDLDTVGYALDRIATRIRFVNEFGGVIEEVRRHDNELEQRFLKFFPELLAFS